MKRRVCCLLLGLCILALPVQQVYAAPAGPAHEHEHEHEHPKPHECKHEHEHPVPPHEKKHEHPLLPHEHVHEHVHPKPHEEKKGPLAEKPVPPHEKEEAEKPTATPAPTATPKPTATPAPTEVPKQDVEEDTISYAGSELVKFALQFVGNPYKYGGTSLTNGADCSGFVQSVFAKFGYTLERTSRDQAKTAGYMSVSLNESALQPGDLIFYANNSGTVSHVGIYIGDGKIVHAANATKGITISPYTYMKPCKARRVVG